MKVRTKTSHVRESAKDRIFEIVVTVVLILFAVITTIPLISELAVSLSSKTASQMNLINLLPVEFTLDSWKYLLGKGGIWTPFLISVLSTILGVIIALLLNVLMAYPLSKIEFKASKYIMLFVVFTMVFAAPKVPYFLTLRSYGLYNSYWVLIFPHIITAYNLIIVRTFFKQFPKELEEAAMIDGCGKFRILFQIVLPASKAVLATVGLFYGVTMWNQYEHPMMFIQKMDLFPLQMKIRSIVDGGSELQAITMAQTANYTPATLSAVAVVFAILPILIGYPWIQKYFAKGAMLGSVKG
ncbi:carbohydrate ABC transporter permease [Blautia liquoris]|jgi:putative aldouronate transport system permease protein|uniref:Carbohydrate ABC transporter permease n=1 Tax=Blautia liquoris TaxID=2779518 RepID=A0A7M2RGZ7_9FIRM|nr:carbohydrate ABC transporter permease [Blautia liquoris]QOV19606.1 carbohydrate ABC transporter permease [Blautia liquoris]